MKKYKQETCWQKFYELRAYLDKYFVMQGKNIITRTKIASAITWTDWMDKELLSNKEKKIIKAFKRKYSKHIKPDWCTT